MGEICGVCGTAINRRAARVGRWVAAGCTLAMAISVWLRSPLGDAGRVVGIVGIAACYVLTYLVATRVTRELSR